MAKEVALHIAGLSGSRPNRYKGPGKSCLCYRFVYPSEAEKTSSHPSVINHAEFQGDVLEGEHSVYWGSRVVAAQLKKKAKSKEDKVCIHVVEHSEFLEDISYTPFPCAPKKSSSYAENVVSGTIKPGKRAYKSSNYLDCSNEVSVYCPSNINKIPRGLLLVLDCSRFECPTEYFTKQIYELETILAHKKKMKGPRPEVALVLTKCDEIDETRMTRVNQLVRQYRLDMFQTSAERNTNVTETFLSLAANVLKIPICEDKVKQAMSFNKGSAVSQRNVLNRRAELASYLTRRVTDLNLTYEQLECEEVIKDVKSVLGKGEPKKAFLEYLIKMKSLELDSCSDLTEASLLGYIHSHPSFQDSMDEMLRFAMKRLGEVKLKELGRISVSSPSHLPPGLFSPGEDSGFDTDTSAMMQSMNTFDSGHLADQSSSEDEETPSSSSPVSNSLPTAIELPKPMFGSLTEPIPRSSKGDTHDQLVNTFKQFAPSPPSLKPSNSQGRPNGNSPTVNKDGMGSKRATFPKPGKVSHSQSADKIDIDEAYEMLKKPSVDTNEEETGTHAQFSNSSQEASNSTFTGSPSPAFRKSLSLHTTPTVKRHSPPLTQLKSVPIPVPVPVPQIPTDTEQLKSTPNVSQSWSPTVFTSSNEKPLRGDPMLPKANSIEVYDTPFDDLEITEFYDEPANLVPDDSKVKDSPSKMLPVVNKVDTRKSPEPPRKPKRAHKSTPLTPKGYPPISPPSEQPHRGNQTSPPLSKQPHGGNQASPPPSSLQPHRGNQTSPLFSKQPHGGNQASPPPSFQQPHRGSQMSPSPSFEYPHTASRGNDTPPSTSPPMERGRGDVSSDISNKKISEKIQFIEKKFGSSPPPQVKPKPFQRPTRSPLSDLGKGQQSPVKNLSVSNSPTTSPKLHFSAEENDQEDFHGRGHLSSPEKTPSHSSASSNSTPILPPRNYLDTLEKTSSPSFSSSSDTTPSIPPRNYSPSDLVLCDLNSEGIQLPSRNCSQEDVSSEKCNFSNSSPLTLNYNDENTSTPQIDRSAEDFIDCRPPMPLPTEINPPPDIKLNTPPSVPNPESLPGISSLPLKKYTDLPSRVSPRQEAPRSPVFRETNRTVSPIIGNSQANLPDVSRDSQHMSVKGPLLPPNSPSVFRPITPVRETVNIPTSPSVGIGHQNLQKISPRSPPQVPSKKPGTFPLRATSEQRMASTFSHSLPKQVPSSNQAWSCPVPPGDSDETQSQSRNMNPPSPHPSTVGSSVVNAPPSVSFTVTSSKQKSQSVRCRPLPELPIAQITTSGHLPCGGSHVYDYVFNWQWKIGEKGQSNLFPSVNQILQERKFQVQPHKSNWSPPLPPPQAGKHPLSPPVGSNNDSDDDYEKMNDNPSPGSVENLQMSVSIAENQYNHETCISVHKSSSRPLPRVRVGTDSSLTSTGYVKVDEPFKDPLQMIVGSDGYIPMKSRKLMADIMQAMPQEGTLTQSSLYYNVPASRMLAGMTSMDLESNQYYNVRRIRQVHNLEYLDVSIPPRPTKPARLSLPPPRPPKPVVRAPPLPPKGMSHATDKRLGASDPLPLRSVMVQQPSTPRFMSNAVQQQTRNSSPSCTVMRSPSHPLIPLPPRSIRRDGPYVWDPNSL